MHLRRIEAVAAIGGCIAVFAALAIIWSARLSVPRELYVSELGAQGEPTATWFQRALLLIVVGGTAIAWAGRRVRSSASILRAWTPAMSLWIGCAFFLFASQVTCSAGCPLPYGSTFTWQDFGHTVAAVLAFAAACWAMLQTSFAREHRMLARLSLATGLLVAGIAAAGGLMSLFHFQEVLGSRLEFVATTMAIAWLIVFGLVTAARAIRQDAASAPTGIAAQPLAVQELEQAVG